MGLPLDDYQLDAVKRLRPGSILCGGVGSGKSRTALVYYVMVECSGVCPINDNNNAAPMKNKKDLYIITTAKKRDSGDWEKECGFFTLTTDRALGYYDVNVTVDSWNNIGKYTNVCNAFFIFDEQRVVGNGSWVKSFLQITKKNHWILLSATPGDTWLDYIPVFIANGFYRNRTEFIRCHVVFKRFCKYPQVEQYINVQRLINIRNRILVDMDYKNPHKITTDYEKVSYDKSLYKVLTDDYFNVYTNAPIRNKSEWLQAVRRLVNCDESRIEKVKEKIFENPKLIIFYNYDYELELLRNLCKSIEVPFSEWNGHKHMPIPDKPNWVYLVQYTAGAEGWECTDTDTILFYSLNYSYKIMIQSRGRIDRHNTPFTNLKMIHIISDSPIDKAILKCLKEKRDFNLMTDI